MPILTTPKFHFELELHHMIFALGMVVVHSSRPQAAGHPLPLFFLFIFSSFLPSFPSFFHFFLPLCFYNPSLSLHKSFITKVLVELRNDSA